MKNYILLFIFIQLCIKTFSQENSLKHYYIVDSLILKNKIKIQMDTLRDPLKENEIIEFDTLGRRVLSYNMGSKIKYRYTYKNSADTILCFLSIISDKNQEDRLIEIQKYLYNRQGKIILHSNCYKNSNNISAQLTRFRYDSSNNLTAKCFYYSHDFSKKLDACYSTDTAAYELNNEENYFYDKNGQMVLVKQLTGPNDERFTETLQYDKFRRLKLITRFQKYGTMGELSLTNILNATKYVYTDSGWIKYESSSYGDNLKKAKALKRMYPVVEKIFYPSGLISAEYLGCDKEKILYRKYEYTYFE